MREFLTQEGYINKCKKVHGDKYDYSKTIYKFAKGRVVITCKIHGDFTIEARQHYRGPGCGKCYHERRGVQDRLSQEEVLRRAKLIWGDRFDYSRVNYVRMNDSCEIKCNQCNNWFNQTMDSHLKHKQNGCKICKPRRGWRRSQWIKFCSDQKRCEPLAYVVRMYNDSENFIKIGITSCSTFDRFNRFDTKYEYEILREFKGSPLFVYDKEIELHGMFNKYKYIPKLKFPGYTECFSIDILPLVKEL